MRNLSGAFPNISAWTEKDGKNGGLMNRLALLLILLLVVGIYSRPAQAEKAHPYPIYEILVTGGAGGWLNVARALAADDMKGKILLLDFWTYGCVNCMQIVPDLDFLEKKYGDKLLVIGIHSAKYKGEQDSERILSAAKRFGLHHPVANDYDYAIWKSLGVQAWPTLVLLGPDGREISRYSGEGHRNDLDEDISDHIKSATNAAPISDLVADHKQNGDLSFPSRIEPAENGVWIADSGHHRIVAMNPEGEITVTIGSGARGLKDGDFGTAQFNHPRGLKKIGRKMYVADTDNHAIREIDLDKKTVKTIVGNGRRGYKRIMMNEVGTTVSLASPWDVDVLPDSHNEKLAIASAGLHQLHVYDIPTGRISVLAGSGTEDIKDGPAAKAELAQPSGLATDGKALYFVDAESSALRKLEDGQVKTLVGTGLFDYGLVDGTYPAAMLQHPQGLTVAGGKIYIADTYNNAVRVYDLENNRLSTLVKESGFSEPGDVLLINGKIAVADTGHHKITELNQ